MLVYQLAGKERGREGEKGRGEEEEEGEAAAISHHTNERMCIAHLAKVDIRNRPRIMSMLKKPGSSRDSNPGPSD